MLHAGTSQFLRVDKPDFDMVLRRSYEKEWQDRLQILSSIPFFKYVHDYDSLPKFRREIFLSYFLCFEFQVVD